MLYLCYLCLFVCSCVQRRLCCVVLLSCFYSSSMPCIAGFSGVSFFLASSVFSSVYLLDVARFHKIIKR
jgi:hypothetical protein